MLARIVALSLGAMGADAAMAITGSTEQLGAGDQLEISCLGAEQRAQRYLNASDKTDCKDSLAKTSPGAAVTTLQESPLTTSALDGNGPARTGMTTPAPDSHPDGDAQGEQNPAAHKMTPDARSDSAGVDSISAGKAGSERQISNLAAGTADTDAVNLGQVKQLVGDGSPQRYLKVAGKNDGSDDAVARGDNSIASGYAAVANDDAAVAIGRFSAANGAGSVAVGNSAVAQGHGGVAIGNNANAAQADNVAIGRDSKTDDIQSIAVGARSYAVGALTTALGFGAGAGSLGSMAIGSGASVGFNSEFSTSVGTGATISNDSKESTALGAGSGINGGTQSLVAGYAAMAFGNRSTSIGAYARVGNDDNTAVGFNSRAGFEDPLTGIWFNNYATALGAASQALATGSTALGAGSLAQADNSVALGYLSLADRENSVSVGAAGSERQITNVAAGTAVTDAVNKQQLDGLADSVSAASHYVAATGKGDGSDDARVSGDYNVALGASSEAIGDHSTAIGAHAFSSGLGSLALGAGAVAISDPGSDANIAIGANASATNLLGGGIAIGVDAATLSNGIAIGGGTQAHGFNGVALGNIASADGNGSIAIGSGYFFADGDDPGLVGGPHAVGRNSIAVGAGATGNGENSVAIGPRAVASGNNSVALGLLSYAERDNTVSVGSTLNGITRQITNVAAGTENNDAVNLAQMNSAIGAVSSNIVDVMKYDDASKQKMTLAGSSGSVIDNLADGALAAGSKQAISGGQLFQVGDSVAQMLGGGAMMGTNGFTGPVFGVQGGNYHNVGDALGALDGALDSLGNRVSNLESGAPVVAQAPKPVAKMARDVAPPVTPSAADPGTGKDIVTQDELEQIKDYADAGNKQTLGSANQYTDKKVANMVTQSDFNDFKGSVDQRFDTVHKKISRVGAMASAMAGMAGAIAAAPPNENRVSAALGGYGGQTALSLGYARRISNSGALLVGASVASGGESSGTVGVSFGW